MDKKLLIIGIDPGTTVGYAFLDLQGNIIKIDSKKILPLSKLILESTKLGRVVLVGSDVVPSPNFVKHFAKRVGARLIVPEKTIQIKEKKKLIARMHLKNKHQKDALSSAVYVYKRVRKLLSRIDYVISTKNLYGYSYDLKKLLLTNNHLNINAGINSILHSPSNRA